MPQFSIPLSGLKASSTALTDIANNLANMNTYGYKTTDTTFQDLYYQLIGNTGGGDPEQLGAGVGVASIETDFTTGNTDSTGVATNVAISGTGFFVVKQSDGSYSYTRDGDFKLDSDGYLVDQNGNQVMGYTATDGVVSTTGSLSALQLGSSVTNPPVETTTMTLAANLNSSTDVGSSWSTSMDVYDSLGTSHTVTFSFTKTAANTWTYNLTVPGSDVSSSTWAASTDVTAGSYIYDSTTGDYFQCTTAGTTDSTSPTFSSTVGDTVTDGTAVWTNVGSSPIVSSGTLNFDSSGNLSSPSSDISGISLTNLASGASDLDITWDLYSSTSSGTGLITQTDSDSAASSNTQDGSAAGTLSSFTIDSDGTIEGSFTNGTRVLGQIVTATFGNQQGLSRSGSNYYTATLSSGQAVVGTPGTGGRGTLAGSELELSNVDMATEFAKLITAQRTFEANAKAITTFDTISEDTINLKR